jgi:hypothetical protein
MAIMEAVSSTMSHPNVSMTRVQQRTCFRWLAFHLQPMLSCRLAPVAPACTSCERTILLFTSSV